jgi:hypothetical protein
MKFQQYLNEELSIDKEIAKLRKLCKPFIDTCVRNKIVKPLWRGLKDQYLSMFNIKTRRKNRKPKDTPDKLQKLADDAFYKEFKWRPRAEGVFATGSSSLADNYGTLFWFFPIGTYHFVWSNRIEDFFIDNDWMSDLYTRDTMNGWKDTMAKGYKEKMANGMDDIINTFQDFDLKSAIDSGHEIMFDCDRYYVINPVSIAKALPKGQVKILYNYILGIEE